MSDAYNEINKLYGEALRVRVSGICVQNNALLLVNHKSLGEDGFFWAPPGGGMNYGSTAEENLKREFKEETGLDVNIKKFLFVHEFLQQPLHAIELFFEVEIKDGVLMKGSDPEMHEEHQIIDDVKFMDWETLKKYKKNQVHQIFSQCTGILEIFNLSGYFKFENNYIK